MKVDEALLRRLGEQQRDPRLLELAWDLREGKVAEAGLARHPIVAAALARSYREALAELRDQGVDPTEAGRRGRDFLEQERVEGRLTDEDIRTGELRPD